MIDTFIKNKEGIFEALHETNYMVFLSMFLTLVFSIIFGSLLFYFREKKSFEHRVAYQSLSILLNTLRSIPFLVFVFMLIPLMRIIFSTSFGNTAAILPLSLVGLSIYSRFVEQALILVPNRIKLRAKSMGANEFQSLVYFYFPSIKSELILSFTSVFISILSYSSVMGVIGAGGLGEFAFRYGYQEYDNELLYLTAIIFALYVLVIQSVGYFLSKIFAWVST